MIIDCHSHLVPNALLAEIAGRATDFPAIRLIDQGAGFGFSFAGGKPTRPVAKPLQDLEKRGAWMAANAIERQVVGGWLDMFGYEIPAREGAAWSRLINRHFRALAGADPRFVPLATVPLQDGGAAAEVLEEAMDAGFPGVMIGTQPKGVGGVLDDPSLASFWEAADRRGAVIFIHPVFESGDNRVHEYRHGQCRRARHRHDDRRRAAALRRPPAPLCAGEDRLRHRGLGAAGHSRPPQDQCSARPIARGPGSEI